MRKSNIHINPIRISRIRPKFRKNTGLEIKLGNTLKGGGFSSI